MNFGILLILGFAGGFKSISGLTGTPTPLPTPTPCPTPCQTAMPTITPTPTTSEGSSCIVPLPTTTLSCSSRQEACSKCSDNQTCVQVGKSDDGSYNCPVFECQDCPEPVCDPPCGCKEECVIERGNHYGHGHKKCPVAKCRALPVCLTCPPVSCDSLKCEENFECKIKPGNCDECPSVSCEPKPCLVCPSSAVLQTCFCPRGKECKIIEGSCYKCPRTICVDVPDPCINCKGECSVSPHPNCENCLPQRLCVKECRQCSPFLPNWECKNPRRAIYISRTCTTCSEYRCLDECKDCSKEDAPVCDCENQDDCILQPRSCNQCPTFYCKKECVKEGPGEECKCEDFNLCVYREGNCFTRSYYECVPPGKGDTEPADLIKGREDAKRRNYK